MEGDFQIGSWLVQPSLNSVSRNGAAVRLESKVMAVLVCLARQAGNPISKEELLTAVWPNTFVSEDALKRCISELRRVFGDDAREPRIIETIPKRGYRLLEPVARVNGTNPVDATSPLTENVVQRPAWWITWIALVMLAAGVGLAAWLGGAVRFPQIQSAVPLTEDGEPKWGRLATDGPRVFFSEGNPGNWKIAEVSAEGGKTAQLSMSIADLSVAGLNSSGSELLAFRGEGPEVPLWLIPLPAGEPRRLEGIEAFDATLFPDGRILFTRGNALFIAERDGTNPRHLLQAADKIIRPSVSVDGARICFTIWPNGSPMGSLQESQFDGSHIREVFKAQGACCGAWTPDGKFLVFSVLSDGRWDLWALPRRNAFSLAPKPVRLTDGPLSYVAPAPSRDGKKIFAIGSQTRSELVRYDDKSRQLIPFLPGISANEATSSRDGKWIAYVSYPDHTLWRSRADGSDRRQLTFRPSTVTYADISPDGASVSFSTLEDEVYVIGANGERLRKVAMHAIGPHWSLDGNSLVLTSSIPGKPGTERNSFRLQTVDLRTGVLTPVPGSDGLVGGFWTASGAIVAGSEDKTKFRLFNFQARQWQDLASGWFVNWFIAGDRQNLYCTTGGQEPKILRIRLADGATETLTALKDLRRLVDTNTGTYLGVAADGAPLLSRDLGTQEIYALAVQWP